MERLKLTLFVKDEFKLFNPDEFVDDEKLSGEVAYQYEKNAKKNSEISICSDNSTEVTINLSGRYCKLTMNSLTFHKRVYQPCEISAVINIIVSDSSRSLIPRQNIISALKDVKVKLENVRDVETDSTKTVTEVIAENYYVHEVLTTYYSSGRSIEASLRIFSLDKKLTFDKFCRAYTAKKLYADILKADTCEMLSGYGISVNDKTELQFLSYERTTTLNTQNDTKDKSLPSTQMCEFIQPYLVQYNESYYDFLVRTANRCGEFFFFEDGKICLGLTQTDSSSARRITTFESITYRDITKGTKEIEDYHHNGTYNVEPKDVTEYANAGTDYTTSKFAYNFEVPVDDYITVFHKDEFADWNSEYVGSWMSKTLKWINVVLNNSDSLKEMLINFGINEAVALAAIPEAINTLNKKQNQENIFDMPAEQRIESAISGINEDGSTAQSASPFTSLIHSSEVKEKYKYKENLTTLFYKTVKMYETQVSSEAVEVDLGVDFMDIKLGDLVRLTDDDKIYVAIEVKGKSGVSNLGTETNFSVLLIPVLLESETKVYTDALNDAKKDISADLKSRIAKEEEALKSAQEKVEAEAHAQTLAEAKVKAYDELQEKIKDYTEDLANAENRVKRQTERTEKDKNIMSMWIELSLLKHYEFQVRDITNKLAGAKAEAKDLAKELEKNQADAQEHDRLRAIYQADVEVHAEALAKLQAELEAEADAKAQDKTNIKKDTITIICPPLCDFPSICSSAPQLAVVGDSSDPKGLGRVRIRYPWQTKDADMSPWIRLATPFATQGGGIFFKPVVGDEVLVDYDGGNIERPYVVGSLYTGKSQVPDGTRVISSANGHSIVMEDPEGAEDFIGNLWEGWEILQEGIPAMKDILPKGKGLAGSLELKDRYGLYSIKMSSSDREVSITSSFGEVKIDAFSGISLSAPNGRIVLNARDIEITAANNISITSGEDLPDVLTQMELEDESERLKKQMSKKERIIAFFKEVYDKIPGFSEMATLLASSIYEKLLRGGTIETIGTTVANNLINKVVDLELLRTFMEILLPPRAGTMSLKSWRFMRLEAGRGQARIPNCGYTPYGLQNAIEEEHGALINQYKVITELSGLVDKWLEQIISYYAQIKNQYNYLGLYIEWHTKPEKSDFVAWDKEKIDNKVKEMIKTAVTNPSKTYRNSDFLIREDSVNINHDQMAEEANKLQKNVKSLVEWVNDPSKVLKWYSKILDRDSNYMKLCIQETQLSGLADPITKPLLDKTETFEGPVPTISQIPQADIKLAKRKLIYLYLNKAQVLESPDYAGTVDDFADDMKWMEFINGLNKKEKAVDLGAWDSLKNSLWNTMTTIKESNTMYDWYKTYNVWGPEKEGEILFSDKNGHTISFDNGHLTHIENDNEHAYIENIKRALKDIN